MERRRTRTRLALGAHAVSRTVRDLLLIAVAIPIVAATLARFATIIAPYLAIRYSWTFELAMVLGQVLFQWVFLARKSWSVRLDYARILIGISTLGALLLWPLLIVDRMRPVSPLFALMWFIGVVGIMFFAHWALVKRHALPVTLCLTWVVYRLIILAVVVRFP